MTRYIKAVSVVLTVILTIFLIRCAVNPVTGKKELMLISESMEIEMGKEIDQALRVEYGIYDDPRLNAYVAGVGMQMVSSTHRPHLQYHFAVLDTPVENAFAAPGGYIYITRGLLAMINSEAELATVLGHELGHVNARHSARQMSRTLIISLGILALGELSEDIKEIAPISFLAAQLLFLKYSRDDEYQADELGIQYSFNASYSPKEMAPFFNSIQRLTESQGGVKIPNFLSTHPLTSSRIDKVNQLLASGAYSGSPGGPPLKVEKMAFIQRTEGLVFGENPRQGYMDGNTFYHPDMRFYFRIPEGWGLNNTPRQVSLAPRNGNAVIILQAEDSTESLDRFTRGKLASMSEPRILEEGFRGVNGLNAFYSYFQFTPGENDDESEPAEGKQQTSRELIVRLTCIRKGGTIFSFFSVAGLNEFSQFRHNMERCVESFSPLTDSRRLDRRPMQITLKRSRGGQTLQDFFYRQGIPNTLWNRLAIINGLQLTDALSPNQTIKVVVN